MYWGVFLPIGGLLIWIIGLLIYGYKKGALGCLKDAPFGPEDFFMGGPHYHNIHVDVHEHHDYFAESLNHHDKH